LYGEKKGETASKCLDPEQKDDSALVEKINPKMQEVKTAPKCLKPKHQQQKKETALSK